MPPAGVHMKCPRCGHLFWNLYNPRCSECGTRADVRDLEYVPGALAFGCPHCPRTFPPQPWEPGWTVCPSCQRKFHWHEVRLLPLVEDMSNIIRRKPRARR